MSIVGAAGTKAVSRHRRRLEAHRFAPGKMTIPNSRNFASCYIELCKQQRVRPLPVICVTLPHSLDLTTDRVKIDDWCPILNSLSLDRTLKSISIRSRFQSRKPLDAVNSEDKARAMGKAPVVLTRYLLEWLSHSVSQCVRNSASLTTLELEGIPFPADCVAVLCIGLSNTQTLNHLSLQRCFIGDSGCELICRTIADAQTVRSLNLSFCDLSCKCGTALATALTRQKLSLYHDAWKQSLRYQELDLETMPGLRRLTLNDNPYLGDSAIIELIQAIRDSLWLKALDIQRCGLSDRTGNELLDLLDCNNTLTVIDARQNVNLNDSLAKEIIKRLEEKNVGRKSEYRWMSLPQKEQRTASVGSRKRTEAGELASKVSSVSRPKSATFNLDPKRQQQLPPRRSAPLLPNASRTRTRPREPGESQARQERTVPSKPKMSLHLDLQARIQPVIGSQKTTLHSGGTGGGTQVGSETASSQSLAESTKVDAATQAMERLNTPNAARISNVLNELANARADQSRLLDETKRSDLLLAEERERRLAAEMKLRAARRNLDRLETALREKETETRGFLLLSQQSLDEICTVFDRLLEMLEGVAGNTSGEEDRADIKRRVASVIRKTKSENLRRSCFDKPRSSSRVDATTNKLVKSESDVRSDLCPASATRLEKNIGDSTENRRSILLRNGQRELIEMFSSPEERTKGLLARILNGDAVLDLSSLVD